MAEALTSFDRSHLVKWADPKNGNPQGPKRLRWTPELHSLFEAACNSLGGEGKAVPSRILEIMGVAQYGVRLAHIKSHLQKYRKIGEMGPDEALRFRLALQGDMGLDDFDASGFDGSSGGDLAQLDMILGSRPTSATRFDGAAPPAHGNPPFGADLLDFYPGGSDGHPPAETQPGGAGGNNSNAPQFQGRGGHPAPFALAVDSPALHSIEDISTATVTGFTDEDLAAITAAAQHGHPPPQPSLHTPRSGVAADLGKAVNLARVSAPGHLNFHAASVLPLSPHGAVSVSQTQTPTPRATHNDWGGAAATTMNNANALQQMQLQMQMQQMRAAHGFGGAAAAAAHVPCPMPTEPPSADSTALLFLQAQAQAQQISQLQQQIQMQSMGFGGGGFGAGAVSHLFTSELHQALETAMTLQRALVMQIEAQRKTQLELLEVNDRVNALLQAQATLAFQKAQAQGPHPPK